MRLVARLEAPWIWVKQESGFSNAANQALRAIHQRAKWVPNKLSWVYPFNPGSVFVLRETAEVLGAELHLDPGLAAQEHQLLDEFKREEDLARVIRTHLDDFSLPMRGYMTQQEPPPWPHQQIAFHWGVRLRNFYAALKPGLGKTRIGSDIIRGKVELGQVDTPTHIEIPPTPSIADPSKELPARWGMSGGVLIVGPRVVLGEWTEQLARWQNIDALPIVGTAEKKRYRAGLLRWVHIVGYDSLESVEGNEYSGIIADEAHYISNDDSNRWNRMMALRKYAKWVINLSGTPISNMLKSLWGQYYFLDYGRTLGPSYKNFREKFLDAQEPAAAVSKAVSRVTMFLTMKQAFPDKKEKIHKVLRVPFTPEQARYYEEVRTKQAADVLTGRVTVAEAIVRIGKLFQIAQGFVYDDHRIVQEFNSGKLKALEDLLTGKGECADARTLVWCYFDPEIDKITAMLKRHKIKHLVLQADMSDSAREEMKALWNTDASYRVLVGKINMGIGINLHAPKCIDADGNEAKCFTTVFFTLTYKVTAIEQAMDRTYRGDQTETCLYYYLLSDDLDSRDDRGDPIKPIDVRMYDTAQMKFNQATEVAEESAEHIRSLLAV